MQACSLVCKDFVPLARRHLFRTIKIGYHRDYSVSHSEIAKIFKKNGYLAYHVDSIWYKLNSEAEEELVKNRDNEDGSQNHPSVFTVSDSVSLLDLFPNIRQIDITCDPSVREDDPSPVQRQIFRDMVRASTVASLSIVDVHMDLRDLIELNQIQILTSSYCKWFISSSEQHPGTAQFHCPSLQLQEITIEEDVYFPVRIIERCPQLQNIRVNGSLCTSDDFFPECDLTTARRDKNVVYGKLHTVSCPTSWMKPIVQSCGIYPDSFGPCAFPALKKLDIMEYENYECSFEGLCEILQHSPQLENIIMTDIPGIRLSVPLPFDTCFRICQSTIKHLDIQFRDVSPSSTHVFEALCNGLTVIQAEDRLETLSIACAINVTGRNIDEWMRTMRDRLRTLGDTIAKLSTLRRFELLISCFGRTNGLSSTFPVEFQMYYTPNYPSFAPVSPNGSPGHASSSATPWSHWPYQSAPINSTPKEGGTSNQMHTPENTSGWPSAYTNVTPYGDVPTMPPQPYQYFTAWPMPAQPYPSPFQQISPLFWPYAPQARTPHTQPTPENQPTTPQPTQANETKTPPGFQPSKESDSTPESEPTSTGLSGQSSEDLASMELLQSPPLPRNSTLFQTPSKKRSKKKSVIFSAFPNRKMKFDPHAPVADMLNTAFSPDEESDFSESTWQRPLVTPHPKIMNLPDLSHHDRDDSSSSEDEASEAEEEEHNTTFLLHHPHPHEHLKAAALLGARHLHNPIIRADGRGNTVTVIAAQATKNMKQDATRIEALGPDQDVHHVVMNKSLR
ncbi:hypothetical protein CVT24_009016 [Panaeolus cyanescens]|uniref:Uncharacterized protein n=1 Tax=Panaeolus cyanescens TaxID=181874 RepID=A0A409YAN6_9AGAR|nr:hypothetical protein CVT24_009016 [Panaeolus cyanescens]